MTDDAPDSDGVSEIPDDAPDANPPTPLPPKGRDVPPDVQAATISLRRALPPSLRWRLRIGSAAAIVVPPSPDWCAALRGALRSHLAVRTKSTPPAPTATK